jgi:8-oxo-dGTP diphosphatase
MERKRPRIGVGVAVLPEGKGLLGKRKGSHRAGHWSFPGGHLDFGESAESYASRELLEETGLKALSTRLGPWVELVDALSLLY